MHSKEVNISNNKSTWYYDAKLGEPTFFMMPSEVYCKVARASIIKYHLSLMIKVKSTYEKQFIKVIFIYVTCVLYDEYQSQRFLPAKNDNRENINWIEIVLLSYSSFLNSNMKFIIFRIHSSWSIKTLLTINYIKVQLEGILYW